MGKSDSWDPYLGNPLVSGLGPILNREEILLRLTDLPPVPQAVGAIPRHVRLHMLMDVRRLHVPPLTELRLFQTLDLMVRQAYVSRHPGSSATWSVISGEARSHNRPGSTATAAAVEGLSGVGKTEACHRGLSCFPSQVIDHASFPRLVGGLKQVVWLSVEVPPSGRSSDLALALMEAWDRATGDDRFANYVRTGKVSDGMKALNEWRQVAVSHFLGVLHLDEVQNLFKLISLKQRTSRQGARLVPELSIVEDQVLRWILNLTNTGQVALLVSGTPDGIGALSRRLSTLGRINTMGYHPFEPFNDPADPAFRQAFLQRLARYQYVKQPLVIDDGIAKLIVELTGGIQRLVIALWIAAHRVALERAEDDLRADDFVRAAATYLAPLAPAVSALQSKSPDRMAMYEDLVPRETAFWSKFWGEAGTA